jgi:hypothetical protein
MLLYGTVTPNSQNNITADLVTFNINPFSSTITIAITQKLKLIITMTIKKMKTIM